MSAWEGSEMQRQAEDAEARRKARVDAIQRDNPHLSAADCEWWERQSRPKPAPAPCCVCHGQAPKIVRNARPNDLMGYQLGPCECGCHKPRQRPTCEQMDKELAEIERDLATEGEARGATGSKLTMRAALIEARTLLGDSYRPVVKGLQAPEDAAVQSLCEQWGYGAIMASVARLYAAAHPDSAKTVGHCRLTVANALARIDKALKETP